jgi:hypothetical protein
MPNAIALAPWGLSISCLAFIAALVYILAQFVVKMIS